MELLGPKFPNVAQENGRLYVASTHTDFGEDLVFVDGKSWRPWDARRSKVGAAVAKRASQLGIKEGDTVLYLGAAHGYTATFIADIVGEKGLVFCLDFSATVVRDLLRKSRARSNMIPILADAKKPETWAYRVTGADVIIMDIAQRDQAAIFLRACERFLRPGGFGILALKARSVDMTRDPRDIFRDTYRLLEQSVKVVDYRELTPLERDHAVFIVKHETPLPGTPSAFPEKSAPSDAGRERRESRSDYRGDSRGNTRSGYNDRAARPAYQGNAAREERPRWQPQPRAQGSYNREGSQRSNGSSYGGNTSSPGGSGRRENDSYVARRDSYSQPRPYGQSKYGNAGGANYGAGRDAYAGRQGGDSYNAGRAPREANERTSPPPDRRKPQRWGGSR